VGERPGSGYSETPPVAAAEIVRPDATGLGPNRQPLAPVPKTIGRKTPNRKAAAKITAVWMRDWRFTIVDSVE